MGKISAGQPSSLAFKYPPPMDNFYVTLSLRPRILYFPRLVSDEELEKIRKKAESMLKRNTVADPLRNTSTDRASGYRDVESQIRNSRQAWLDIQTGFLRRVQKRLLGVLNH